MSYANQNITNDLNRQATGPIPGQPNSINPSIISSSAALNMIGANTNDVNQPFQTSYQYPPQYQNTNSYINNQTSQYQFSQSIPPNQFTSTQKSPKKKTYNYTGARDEKVPKDMYHDAMEENEHLKKQLLLTNEKIKKLGTESANIRRNVIKERMMADRKGNGSKANTSFEKDYISLENENYRLKDKIEKMKIYMQGLQSDKKRLAKPNGKLKNSKKGVFNCAKTMLETQKNRNDNLALISTLREQLKIANEDRRNLLMELQNRNTQMGKDPKFRGTNSTGRIPQPDVDYKAQIAYMQTDMHKTSSALNSQNHILDYTKQRLEEYIDKYEKEKEKNRQLEIKLSIYESESDKLKEYQSLIEDYKNRERIYEQKISDLCDSPFIKQAEERGNIFKKYERTSKELDDLEKKFKENEFKLKHLERENKQLKEDYDQANLEKDKTKEELMKLKISIVEKEKNDKAFEEQINLLGQYGEVDSNFNKLITIMKLNSDKSNLNNTWEDINFLEKMNSDKANDPVFLKKEIERIKIDNGILGRELEKTKDMLILQQGINEDIKKVQDFDLKKYQSEIKLLKERIEKLCKLIDMERVPKEFLVKDEATGKVTLKNKNEFLNELVSTASNVKEGGEGQARPSEFLDDKITEFSENDSEAEFSMNENALDIYLGQCEFEDGIGDELGFSVENLMSFFTVDFFVHETQTSDILAGKSPMFNMQLSFRLNIDEQVLTYFDSDYIYIELYYVRDGIQSILGKGRISLKDLLDVETENNKTSTRVINSICVIYLFNNENLKIASLHYKMRMRNPISEVMKWYHDQNVLLREKDPVRDLMQKNVEKEIELASYTGGKIYNVNILITKAINLIVSGPPRKILPYFYYKFYKDFEKFSIIGTGNNPQFSDVGKYNVIYNKELDDYIEHNNLTVYIFDSANPIEVDVMDKDVKLVNTNQQVNQDLIGICNIPLKSLLINNLVQGNFNILSENNKKVGELVVNIYWEEIKVDGKKEIKTYLPYENKVFEDQIILRLADFMKNKKALDVESAFKLFAIDRDDEITLENFRNTVTYQLKFTQNQSEMEHLLTVLFHEKGRVVLNKKDFYQIFAMLLPHKGQAEELIRGNNYTDSYNIQNNSNYKSTNNNQNSNSLHSQPNTATFNRQSNPQTEPINSKTSTINNNSSGNMNNTNIIPKTNKGNDDKNVTIKKKDSITDIPPPSDSFKVPNSNVTNRNIYEIAKLIADNMNKTGKKGWVDIYKKFDQDISLKIDPKELYKGLESMGIILSQMEFRRLWKEITNGDLNDKKGFEFKEFKRFCEKYSLHNIAEPNINKSQSKVEQIEPSYTYSGGFPQQGNINSSGERQQYGGTFRKG